MPGGRMAPGWWVIRGGPEHQSLIARARHANENGKKRLARGEWVPSPRLWMALFSLADDGPLHVGDVLVPGGSVNHQAARELVRRGLAERVGPRVRLTDAGRARVERKW